MVVQVGLRGAVGAPIAGSWAGKLAAAATNIACCGQVPRVGGLTGRSDRLALTQRAGDVELTERIRNQNRLVISGDIDFGVLPHSHTQLRPSSSASGAETLHRRSLSSRSPRHLDDLAQEYGFGQSQSPATTASRQAPPSTRRNLSIAEGLPKHSPNERPTGANAANHIDKLAKTKGMGGSRPCRWRCRQRQDVPHEPPRPPSGW